jgi:hypothetical protein
MQVMGAAGLLEGSRAPAAAPTQEKTPAAAFMKKKHSSLPVAPQRLPFREQLSEKETGFLG